jgi:hypothetical protein
MVLRRRNQGKAFQLVRHCRPVTEFLPLSNGLAVEAKRLIQVTLLAKGVGEITFEKSQRVLIILFLEQSQRCLGISGIKLSNSL